MKGGEICI